MPDRPVTGALGEDAQPQYVHCTGGMFVLIPDNKTTSPRNRDGTHRKPDFGSYKDYIAWQRTRSNSAITVSRDVEDGDSKVRNNTSKPVR